MKNRILKMIPLLLLSLAVLVWGLPTTAYAAIASYDPANFIHDVTFSGDTKTVTYHFDDIDPLIYVYNAVDGARTYKGETYTYYPKYSVTNSTVNYYYMGTMAYANQPAPAGGVIDVSDIMPGAALTLSCDYRYRISFYDTPVGGLSLTTRVTLWCYDANGNMIQFFNTPNVTKTASQTGDIPFDYSLTETFELPSDVAYICPIATATIQHPGDAEGLFSITFEPWDFRMTCDVNMIYENSGTMDAINDKLDAIGDKLDDTNDKLDDTNDKLDEIIDQPEQEKQEATNQGGSSADELISVVPDESQGFMNAVQGLASAMSYSGTAAVLTTPAVDFPQINGLVPGFRMMEPMEVDFGNYIQMMPDYLLLLVQSLFTIALIVFCFRELYGTISYVLTLKGGGN